MITPWLSTISAIRIGAALFLIGVIFAALLIGRDRLLDVVWALPVRLLTRPRRDEEFLHPSWKLPADDPTDGGDDGHTCEITRRVA